MTLQLRSLVERSSVYYWRGRASESKRGHTTGQLFITSLCSQLVLQDVFMEHIDLTGKLKTMCEVNLTSH